MTENKKQFDVVVLGAGMVGAAVALHFLRKGLEVAVVESTMPKMDFDSIEPDMRMSAFSFHSVDMLKRLDAWQHLDMSRARIYTKLSVFEDENAYTEFDASDVSAEYLGYFFENRNVQVALHKAINQYENLCWFDGAQIVDPESGQLLLNNGDALFGNLIVVAEGAASQSREKLGIGTTGWQYQQKVLAFNIELESDAGAHTWQRFHTSGPKAFLPLYDNYATLILYDCAEHQKRMMATKGQALINELQQYYPQIGRFKVLDHAYFPIARMHAQSYSKGRVALVGDSAHSINPLAGQGVNIGFKDAEALGRVNPAHDFVVLREALVQYEKERRKDNLLMMSAMDGFYGLFSNDNKVLKIARNLGLKLANQAGPLKNKVLAHAMGLNAN